MNAYSEDLRKKIVEAKERGMPTVEVARTFSVGLSSGMRYAKVARQGGSLRPKRGARADARRQTNAQEGSLGSGDLRERDLPLYPLREVRVVVPLRSVGQGLG